MRVVAVVALGLALGLALAAPPARAATRYQVGPSRKIKQLTELADRLGPGDIVEVDGGAVYAPIELKRSGTKAQPIVLKGVRKDGKRPVIQGGQYTVILKGGFTTLDGFEIRGGTEVCVLNKAHGIVIRDAMIHACARHGVLGADDLAGSLTLSYVEVCDSGGEPKGEKLKHPIYVATDAKLHPDAVFRLEHSWIHRNNGGNSVKSRARRTEIYYNWIEGAQYYELELIGPEDKTGLGPPREDADVVGNVLASTSDAYVTRIGSDGAGASEGRVRFVNNTFLMAKRSRGVVRLHEELESVEFYNNVFIHAGDWSQEEFLRDMETKWVSGRRIRGSNNFVSRDPRDIPNFPGELTATTSATDACFEDLAGQDVRPRDGSPLADAGTSKTRSAWSPANALEVPAFVPPLHAPVRPGGAVKRVADGAIDLGAYELGAGRGPTSGRKCTAKVKGGSRSDADVPPASGGPLRTPGRARMFGLIGGAAALVAASVLIVVGIRRNRTEGGRT